MAVDSDVLDQQRWQVSVPVASFGQIVEVRQQPLLGELADGNPDIPLKCSWGIATGDGVQHSGMLGLRTDRGAVDPFAPALLVFLGKYSDCARFAAARPPVHDLSILS